ncbi:hypothetical protein [Lysinibacillus xylanilyticus]|uniref:Uncharacterized protein n=1 Tax=Lysinibacillus xylanilyticus TaxID=582475 RepID=A0ABT4ELV2_9BACI|nr:hypothetical protein [Lysinibacillus xylanilyticus]MCY9546645.1 hypothetical protein [Lysinibacillus xylanilyticus]
MFSSIMVTLILYYLIENKLKGKERFLGYFGIATIPINLLLHWQIDQISEHYNPHNSNLVLWVLETLKPEHIVTHEHPSNTYINLYKGVSI